jgi:two-component system, cell cycle response regulator
MSTLPKPKKRILLVDDSRFVRATFKSILANSFEVVEAADGEEGWVAIKADPSIVLVFSDLSMPKLDGYGLLERTRKADDARLRQLPVVIISGNEDDGAKSKARAAGANDFISKTADATEILTRIENLLKLADTTQGLKRIQLAAEQTATHDPLSGALTMHYLITEGRKHFARAKRHAGQLSVMVMAVDNHPELLRTLGAEAAGELLRRIAKMVMAGMRAEDSFGRTGDATFTLLSAGTGPQPALAFARRLQDTLQGAQISHGGKVHKVSAKFGVASLAIDQVDSIEELMKRALERMRKPEAAPAPAPVAAAPARAPAPAAPAPAPATLPSDIDMALRLVDSALGRPTLSRPMLVARLQALIEKLKKPGTAE